MEQYLPVIARGGPRGAPITGAIADGLLGAGANPDPQVIFARMTDKTNEGRRMAEKAVAGQKATRTAAQWARLPDSVKSMPTGRGAGAGAGAGAGERRGAGE